MYKLTMIWVICVFSLQLNARKNAPEFTRQDTLRGMLSPERTCYNVHFYDLNLEIDIAGRAIKGYNHITYSTVHDFNTLQVDLFSNLRIDSIIHRGQSLKFEREGNATFVHFDEDQPAGIKDAITIYYQGIPVEAKKPPWDGGFVWKKDSSGNEWVGVACQGIGASLWWPNKDHPSEEPDSMSVTLTVPDTLVAVSNGRLISKKPVPDGKAKYQWFVSNPINNYNITLNIAKYARFTGVYKSKDGPLDLDYYVLEYNLEKAKKHFKQVPGMLAYFEKYFGPYPFRQDSYKLVETGYWGMEHQSAIAYGNDYQNNIWDFDYIIIHESAHEWFGNSLSCTDFAELWLHESFTTYSEAIYVEERFGKETAEQYLLSQKFNIENEQPIIGPFNVHYDDYSGDIYYKGAWMLHTFRRLLDNDKLWLKIIYEYTARNAKSHVTTQIFVDLVNEITGKDYAWFFEQYLEYKDIPEVHYKLKKTSKGAYLLEYKLQANVQNFKIPVQVFIDGKMIQKLYPEASWKSMDLKMNKPENFSTDLEMLLVKEIREY